MASEAPQPNIMVMRLPGEQPGERAELPGSESSGGPDSADGAGPHEAAQMSALEDLARSLHSRGLAPAAIFVLEAMRPLSFVTAEFMVFLEPFVGVFLPAEKYRIIAEALHDRQKISWLCDRLEELDEQGAAAQPVDAAGGSATGDASPVEPADPPARPAAPPDSQAFTPAAEGVGLASCEEAMTEQDDATAGHTRPVAHGQPNPEKVTPDQPSDERQQA